MDKEVRQDWQLKDHFGQLSDDAKGFLNTKLDVWVLSGAERLGILSARTVLLLVGLTLVGMVLVFSSFALAFWLGEVLESTALGYLSVAGIYILFSVAFWVFWKYRLRNIIILNVVNEIYNDH